MADLLMISFEMADLLKLLHELSDFLLFSYELDDLLCMSTMYVVVVFFLLAGINYIYVIFYICSLNILYTHR